MLKKEYKDIVDSSDNRNRALVAVLSQPEFRPKVADKIDLEDSNRVGWIRLKRR